MKKADFINEVEEEVNALGMIVELPQVAMQWVDLPGMVETIREDLSNLRLMRTAMNVERFRRLNDAQRLEIKALRAVVRTQRQALKALQTAKEKSETRPSRHRS